METMQSSSIFGEVSMILKISFLLSVCLIPETWTKPDETNVHIHLGDITENEGVEGGNGDYADNGPIGPVSNNDPIGPVSVGVPQNRKIGKSNSKVGKKSEDSHPKKSKSSKKGKDYQWYYGPWGYGYGYGCYPYWC